MGSKGEIVATSCTIYIAREKWCRAAVVAAVNYLKLLCPGIARFDARYYNAGVILKTCLLTWPGGGCGRVDGG